LVRSLESKLSTVSTQLEDIQEKMYDFEQNKGTGFIFISFQKIFGSSVQ
jgi:hypothetical protein